MLSYILWSFEKTLICGAVKLPERLEQLLRYVKLGNLSECSEPNLFPGGGLQLCVL